MRQDLKSENNRTISLIMGASVMCSLFIQFEITALERVSDLAILGGGGVLLSAVAVMLTNLTPHSVKHKLVFLRFRNEMPGCRVHKLCKKDSRVDYEELALRWPDVFASDIDEKVRNSRWYQRIYKTVKENDEVRQAHRNFLLYRDVFSGLLILLLIVTGGYWGGDLPIIGQVKSTVIYVQIFFLVMALIAANIAGKRMVVNAVVVA